MKKFKSPDMHLMRPSKGKITLRKRVQLLQAAGQRVQNPTKITLPEPPWEEEEWEEQQSSSRE